MSAAETALDRVRRVYGEPCPDWIEELAEACDRSNQTAVAARLDYSRTVVSLALNGGYDRDLSNLEARVRRHLMGAKIVSCPVRGEITVTACRANQAAPFSNSNSARVALYRACRSGCPHSSIPKEMPHG
jgi:hypothetical protein